MRKWIRKARQTLQDRSNRKLVTGKTKYFCIGRNKTGTTSLKKAFEDLGYVVGRQLVAEQLADKHYADKDFNPLIQYCETAQVFQDVPFSWAETYKYMDKAFPNSRFILSVRDDAEQWYRSITKFHAKAFGNGSIPTAEELKNVAYIRKGWMYDAVKIHGTPDDDLYNKGIMIAHYEQYNDEVRSYFSNRSDDLLVINIADKKGYQQFVDFIQEKPLYDDFPWENKT